MEEIITLDGRQFKLTVDRPLTAQEKAQTLAEIRKQTGCGACGTKTSQPVGTMDWKYGGVKSLQTGTPTSSTAGVCIAGPIGSGSTVTLNAAPTGGVAPYTVQFSKQIGCTITAVAAAEPGVAESPDGIIPTTTPVLYALTDIDVAGSTGCAALPTATVPNAPVTISVPILANGTVRFLSALTDSCPVPSGGPGYCVQHCDIALVCVAPTCNFRVT
jgi:hypothetical protein